MTSRPTMLPLLLATVAGLGCASGDNHASGAADGGAPTGGNAGRAAPVAGPDVALTPLRVDGIRFAYPAEMVRRDAPAKTYLFEPAVASDDAPARFSLTYHGRVPRYLLPAGPDYFIRRDFEARKIKLVGKIRHGAYNIYSEALGDTGVDGPGRYVLLMYIQRWDTPSDPLTFLQAKLRGSVPPTVALITAELTAARAEVLGEAAGFVLESIGWSASVQKDEIPATELVGKWDGATFGLSTFRLDANDVKTGGESDAGHLTLSLAADGSYELTTRSLSGCWGLTTCVKGGLQTQSRGRYRYEGGVLTLTTTACEVRPYDVDYMLLAPAACRVGQVPLTLRLEPDENGKLRINGLGQSPLRPEQETSVIERAGQPGSWNVPRPDVQNRVPGEPDGPIYNRFSACGGEEAEPNDLPSQATPYHFGDELPGCLPSQGDFDLFELTPPQGDPAGGYILGEIFDVGPGPTNLIVERVDAAGTVDKYEYSDVARAHSEGKGFVFSFAAAPEFKYRVTVRVPVFGMVKDPFRYTFKAAFHPVKDPNETDNQSNNVPDKATPMMVGVPQEGLLINPHSSNVDIDNYTVTLQPGLAIVSVVDGPESNDNSITIEGPMCTDKSLFVCPTIDGNTKLGTLPIEVDRFWVPRTTSYTIRIRDWLLGSYQFQFYAGGVPEVWTKPYHILVTQPPG
jgi:hypothetical protein